MTPGHTELGHAVFAQHRVRRLRARTGSLLWLAVFIAMTLPAHATARPDWKAYQPQPASWHQSDEGRQVAENILTWQTPAGTWPKNLDTASRPYQGVPPEPNGTFDNGASFGEVRFLAAAYTATQNPRYATAIERCLRLMLRAQYPNGGWPQYYPPGSGYARHITFNDHSMVNLMTLLREVATDEQFAFLDESLRDEAAGAFERGVQCILACQIRIDGRPTAWCAQHDHETLAPRPARTYELESLSGGESVGIVRLLMSLDEPTPEVIQAIEGACQWFEQVQLTGIRLDRTDGDCRVVVDPTAEPLWARFYDPETMEPMFCGRDGIVKRHLAEIEKERRTGYAWYVSSPQGLLESWPRWRQRHGLPAGE